MVQNTLRLDKIYAFFIIIAFIGFCPVNAYDEINHASCKFEYTIYWPDAVNNDLKRKRYGEFLSKAVYYLTSNLSQIKTDTQNFSHTEFILNQKCADVNRSQLKFVRIADSVTNSNIYERDELNPMFAFKLSPVSLKQVATLHPLCYGQLLVSKTQNWRPHTLMTNFSYIHKLYNIDDFKIIETTAVSADLTIAKIESHKQCSVISKDVQTIIEWVPYATSMDFPKTAISFQPNN